jgi:cytochrome P450
VSVPEIDLTDVAVLRDLPTAYARARERAPVARLLIPGFPMWAVLRHDAAKAMLADSRFALSSNSYQHPAVPDDCRPYLRSLQEMEGAEHARLRRLVSPAFTPRRAAQFRPRIARIVGSLLDGLTAANAPVDLVPGLARPLPMEVICEVVGIPEGERAHWHTYGAAVASGRGDAFAEAIPAIIGDAKAAVARRREEPADDLLSDLVRARTDDGDQLDDVEIVALVWLLVLAGQTPTNLIANAVAALLTHPAQLATLRADPELLPGAVDELMRWCGPQLLTVPRFAAADAEIADVPIPEGAAVTVSILAANRDPRVFPDPDRLDLTRPTGPSGHLGFAYGPHFCLGAALARVQTAVALDMLLSRWPDLRLACDPTYQPDPATWRLAALPVHIRGAG